MFPEVTMPIQLPPPRAIAILLGTSLTLFALARGLTAANQAPKIIRSPRDTSLPRLSKEEREKLPYPPDVMPGARDVESAVCVYAIS